VGVLGNNLANETAAEARKKDHVDSTIRISQAFNKNQSWRGSPRTVFLVQAAFHHLQSGHVHLNAFQFKCRQTHFPICKNCDVFETVDHYLISCCRYDLARWATRALLQEEKIARITTRTLLHNPHAFNGTETFLTLSAQLTQLKREHPLNDEPGFSPLAI
jgi:hypothetical protein